MRLRRLRNKRTAEEVISMLARIDIRLNECVQSAGLNEGSEGFEPFSEAGAATPATHAPASVRSRAEKKSALLSLSSTRRGSKRRRFNETYSDDERDGDQNEDQDESDAGAGIDEDNFVVSDDDESEESELGPPIIHDSNTVAKGRQDPLYTLTLGALDQRNSLAFFKASIDSLLPDCTPKKLLRPLPYNKGRSLVHTTCAALRPDILRYLLDLANSDKNSDPPLTRRVLEGVDSDDGSSGGCTPVHIAAAMGSLESLQTIKDAVNLCRKATAAAKASTATLNLKSRSRQVISDEEDDDSNSDFDDSEGWDTELLLIQDNEGFSPICRAIATKASQQVIQFLLDWMKEAGCVFAELSCVPDEESKESINDDADLTDCGILFVAARMGRPSVFHACQKTFGPESILPAMSTRTKGSGATILHYACAAAFILGTPAALECVRFIVQFYDSHGLNKLILVRDNTNLSRDQLLKAATQSDRKGSPKFSRVAALYALGVGVPWDVDEELKPGEEFEEIDYTVPRCFFKLEADNVVEDAFNVVMEANVEQEHERELQELQAHEAKDETIARVVECLVDAGTSMAASEDGSSGATMLHFAALNGFERVVRFLTSRGLSARIKDKLSLTPLIYAHMSESLDKVSDGCLLALLESDPSQLEELMLFLEMSRQHTKLVKNLMKSLATKPRAYKFVNSFLRGIIKSTKRYEVMEWFAGYPQLLDFKNR
ncbi:hypothetical protein BC830DRAFT_648503 [Chytriomyces sp. MP71]|nr:hypothetical protein BC830DRAFT_648503 [Chytriomyces sp. MP71]